MTDNQAIKSLKKLYHSAQQKNEKLFVFFNFKLPTFTAANKQCPQIADFWRYTHYSEEDTHFAEE